MKIPIVVHVPMFAVALAGTVAWSAGSGGLDVCPIVLLAWFVAAGLGGLRDYQRREPTLVRVRRQTTRRPRSYH